VAFVIALAVLATPALLFAHARLLRSTPAANATLTVAPTTLSLWFSEQPELKFTVISLTDSAGGGVGLGPVSSIESNGVSVPISGALASGRYTVAWRTAASDGHATSGKYQFTLSVAAGVNATPSSPLTITVDTARPKTAATDSTITHKIAPNSVVFPQRVTSLSTAMRWAELVALLTLIGLMVFRLAVLPSSGWSGDLVTAASDRAARLARGLLVLFAVATVSRGLAQASLLPGFYTSRHTAVMTLVHETRWGGFWLIGLVGLAVAIIGFLLAGKFLAGWIVAAIGLVTIAVSEALTGHSSAVSHAALAIAADVAHLLGAGGWLGGLTAVLLCGVPVFKRLDPVRANNYGSRLVRAYHNTAMECVIIVVLTAIIAACLRLPAVNALWTTPYGLALLRKIIFVLVVLAFGFYNWRRVVIPDWTKDTLSRFRRSAFGELLFGAVVLALTAYLLTQPLP
jgi:putative copper export protein/methionine-rich copper-binding protein CopC